MKEYFKTRSWPSCIMHIDADAFFASVEQVLNPKLRNKPVIVGAERGVVVALSYQAKERGVKRGMRLFEAKKVCPEVISLSGNYENYLLFSKKMFEVLKGYTPMVEEYSIDEAFIDLSGLRRVHHKSYIEIAEKIKREVETQLGFTVSVGVSLTKGLAKLCSKKAKPAKLIKVDGKEIKDLLQETPLSKIWGFGQNTIHLLEKYQVKTAFDFVQLPNFQIKKLLGKNGLEIQAELSGDIVNKVNSQPKSSYASIQKVKTFTPASSNYDFIYSQAFRNLEKACYKARSYGLKAGKFSLSLKEQNFRTHTLEVKLNRKTASIHDFIESFNKLFEMLFQKRSLYRATGIRLSELSADSVQLNFFENPIEVVKIEKVSETMDKINQRYGQSSIHHAESLNAYHFFAQNKFKKLNKIPYYEM